MTKDGKLTIQEDKGSGSFVQHVRYGGLRGEFTWKVSSPFKLYLNNTLIMISLINANK